MNKKVRNESQGYVLRVEDYNFNNVFLGSTYTQILSSTEGNRVDLKLDFRGDGNGFVYISLDGIDDYYALRFNDADSILDNVSSFLSNYSGEVYARYEGDLSGIECITWEAIK